MDLDELYGGTASVSQKDYIKEVEEYTSSGVLSNNESIRVRFAFKKRIFLRKLK